MRTKRKTIRQVRNVTLIVILRSIWGCVRCRKPQKPAGLTDSIHSISQWLPFKSLLLFNTSTWAICTLAMFPMYLRTSTSSWSTSAIPTTTWLEPVHLPSLLMRRGARETSTHLPTLIRNLSLTPTTIRSHNTLLPLNSRSEFTCTQLFLRSDFNISESPYPEVRASVSSIDDPLMPVNTFRVYVLSSSFWLGLTLTSQMVSGHVFRSCDVWSQSNFWTALWVHFPIIYSVN